MSAMNKYLACVLSVIAVGVLVIAHTLAFPRTSSTNLAPAAPVAPPLEAPLADAWGRPVAPSATPPMAATAWPAAARDVITTPTGERWVTTAPAGYQVSDAQAMARPVTAVQTVSDGATARAPRRLVRQRVERVPRRDWKKTAMVVGGTTAAGAGLGGILAGKKGALIGAAIGGGASTIYETTR